jgi:hypothetical protein
VHASRITHNESPETNVFKVFNLLSSGISGNSLCQAAPFSRAPPKPSRSNGKKPAGTDDPVPELRDVRDTD